MRNTQERVLEIIQSVCYRLNLPAPTAIYGQTDPAILQWKHLLYAVLEELRGKKVWPTQKRTYSFSTVASTTQYALPGDFFSFCLGTYWNQTDQDRLDGPLSDEDFSYRLYGIGGSADEYAFRVKGCDLTRGQFYIDPEPTSVQTLSYEYITATTLWPREWTTGTSYPNLSVVAYRENTYANFGGTGTAGATPPTHTTGSASDGAVTWTYRSSFFDEISNDDDSPIFDADLVKLGIRAKFLEDNGGNYQDAKAEYLNKVNEAVARLIGSYKGSFIEREASPRYSVPYKGWTF